MYQNFEFRRQEHCHKIYRQEHEDQRDTDIK